MIKITKKLIEPNNIYLGDSYELLQYIPTNSVDLILVDLPYIISKKSNFKKSMEKENPNELDRKYNISIDFGEWDKEKIDFDKLLKEYNRVLKKKGTMILFYDIWKMNEIKEVADKIGLKQPRISYWEKTNPVPINSKINYLSNAREYFVSFVKGGTPTFNSSYDNGSYRYPICHGKERTAHPNQKPLPLIKDLIEKHSNEGDIVLDTHMGSGTTCVAAILTKRRYIGMENVLKYFNFSVTRINEITIDK